jgi:hypothetical protein
MHARKFEVTDHLKINDVIYAMTEEEIRVRWFA